MSYLVLARKWRPKTFETLIGQDHVVKALQNALSTQRLHHAWLFTGTRGVGKTTLARILAKSLNCEQGISANPCGTCSACTQIDQGRFVDYLEFDAASNRRVEEMTQLLEQAVYAPSVGRFKIYTIDEVHMLTGHAFNAMLKTLEEPPPHVKFILATTDPQKIPVTVLSRCLQFNLKQMTPDAIVGHLQHILQQEQVQYDTEGLRLIAHAAAGSMRDALSITDQAIAYTTGQINADQLRHMLGTVDQRYLFQILSQLTQQNASALLGIADALYAQGFSFSNTLESLAKLLATIAIEQQLPNHNTDPDQALVAQLAQAIPADLLQLWYSVCIHGRSELSLSPDEYTGFTMTLLRLLSLAQSHIQQAVVIDEAEKKTPESAQTPVVATQTPEATIAIAPSTAPAPIVAPSTDEMPPPWEEAPTVHDDTSIDDEPAPDVTNDNLAELALQHEAVSVIPMSTAPTITAHYSLSDMTPERWLDVAASLKLQGMALELLRQLEWVDEHNGTITLKSNLAMLAKLSAKTHLTTALTEYFGQVITLQLQQGQAEHTLFTQATQAQQARLHALWQHIQQDPWWQQLQQQLPGHIHPEDFTLHATASA